METIVKVADPHRCASREHKGDGNGRDGGAVVREGDACPTSGDSTSVTPSACPPNSFPEGRREVERDMRGHEQASF